MSAPGIETFASRAEMGEALAGDIAALARAALEDPAARASLALSGGSTPEPLYRALAEEPLDWTRLRLALVDERWVGIDHPRSNEAFLRRAFAAAREPDIVGLYTGDPSPADALDEAQARLRPARALLAAVLGLGADGHTASWFPHASGLARALAGPGALAAIEAERSEVTGAETARITMTLPEIARADRIFLLIAGEEKRAAAERALHDGAIEDMPVRAILRLRPDLRLCWAP